MPPKTETYLTEERIAEVRGAIEAKGIEVSGLTKAQYEKISEAMEAGFKLPSLHALEQEQQAATGHRVHSRLVTYLVHQAKEFNEARGQ
jgi:hypothetical protein